ncbi:helix-hairpin-helix domain-containing protein [Clostridium sp. OS1-26]|uniref:helix-hairpin-helix domain-containing protein n=1 Tax=Clostridium sp. OS1-26 TaxID=3070681 RepID=UPI0027E1F137|nr:helix-hairpin-helix domain-containing protein [Clostridium sp. OS1-26]WML34486.1 helix-hairpin-helix domain-containing protein [Clostridium sp. OS1-26]
MKKFIFVFITCIMLFFTMENVFAKDAANIVVLKATDELKDGFPVYEEGGDEKSFMDIYNKSFIKNSIELYAQAQQYSKLKNEDIYIAFKNNSGCYGRIGFYLKKDGKLYDKKKSPYIELSTNQLKGNYDALESITQIFPHEMGHILYQITAAYDKDMNQHGVDMHYSNIITEYSTAFNEGFAEHFEVISRIYEENEQIKNGIYNDIERTKSNIASVLNRGTRDFILPLRLDYYRETSPLWQQKYENLKRHELGLSGDGKYKNLCYDFRDAEKTILYRNMGLFQNKSQKISLEQSLSTEIVVSHFFIKLITTDKGNLDERYSKIFNVFNKYVNKDNNPQLIQFVKGYIKEYPQDRERILNIFKESTGHDFTEECAPEIWVVSEDKHINIIMDQFGGLEFPFYIFNINTCEKEDLLKLKNISKSDAEKIIAYRDKNKYFKDVKEFEKIEGISKRSAETLKSSSSEERIKEVSKELEKKFGEGKFEKSFSNIFSANLKHLISRSIIWFIVFFIIYYVLVMRNRYKDKKNLFKTAAKKFFKFILYVLLGIIATVVNGNIFIGNKTLNPIIVFTALIFICEGITLLALRKDSIKVRDSFTSTLMMMVIIMYSLY